MELVKFLHEVGSLKLTPRAGWLKLGIKDPESVAEHSFRTAVIAFIIAFRETKDLNTAFKAATAALFHDLHETRTMDIHKVAKEYVTVNEEKAIRDQMRFLGLEIDFSDVEEIIRDADKLELAFQAVEYSKLVESAIEFAEGLEFKTDTAKEIYNELMKRRDPRWWR